MRSVLRGHPNIIHSSSAFVSPPAFSSLVQPPNPEVAIHYSLTCQNKSVIKKIPTGGFVDNTFVYKQCHVTTSLVTMG